MTLFDHVYIAGLVLGVAVLTSEWWLPRLHAKLNSGSDAQDFVDLAPLIERQAKSRRSPRLFPKLSR